MIKAACVALFTILSCYSAALADPQFQDYSALPIYSGPHVSPDFSTPDAYQFRSRLREAAKSRINFAGEYTISEWGCGGGCAIGAAVNVRTGKVVFLPSLGIGETDVSAGDPYEFYPVSRLLAAKGSLGVDGVEAVHYFLLGPTGFEEIRSEVSSSATTPKNSEPSMTTPLTTVQLRALCVQHDPLCGQRLDIMFNALVQLGQASGSPMVCPGPSGKPPTSQLIGLFLASDSAGGSQYDNLPAVAVAGTGFRAAMPCP